MKVINNVTLRITFTLVLGIVLIICPLTAINYLVITIGILFLIPGLISILKRLVEKEQASETRFPIESVGSIILGLALIFVPDFFIGALMYILAGVLIFVGILQIWELFVVRKHIWIPVAFYIPPVVVLLAGIVVLFNPFEIIETTFVILGIACIIYSVSGLVNYLKFLKKLD